MKHFKILYKTLSLVFLVILASACGKDFPKADMILAEGLVLTPGSLAPVKASIAVLDGKILTIGDKSVVRRHSGPDTRVVNASGCTIVAGLHDAHVHFESGAKTLARRLSLRFMNLTQIQSAIQAAVAASPRGALIKGYHFNHAYFPGGSWPSRRDIDKVAPDNPVIISRVDGHSVWVNSRALAMAGISKNTPDPPGGEIQRDPGGEPTGILKENAEKLVEGIKAPAMILPGNRNKDPLLAGIRHANRLGLTSITTSGSLELIKKLENLRKRGVLTLRFHVWLDGEKLAEHLEAGAFFNQGGDFIRVAFLKLFADGTIGSASAAMFTPYIGSPESRGILIHPIEELDELVAAAHRNGWPVGVHAIGNRGVHLVLNAIEKARSEYGVRHLRHRIEHSQFVRDSDLSRYIDLGVIASMQPTHCTSDLLVVENRIGKERARQGYRWNSFLQAKVTLAFGTDWPIEPLDPRRGLYSAVDRRNIENALPRGGWFQEEAISLVEALQAYSLGSAMAVHREKELGSLEEGKWADFTVFSGNPVQVAAENPRGLLGIPVEMTIVQGKIVYSRNREM